MSESGQADIYLTYPNLSLLAEGVGRIYAHCRSRTGRHTYGRPFKSRPSAICTVCGDDPVSYNGSRVDYDLAHGWPYVLTEESGPLSSGRISYRRI